MSGFWRDIEYTKANGAITGYEFGANFNDNRISEMILRNSGALQQITQTKQALDVAKDPAKQLDEYKAKVQAISAAATAQFKTDYAFLLGQGLPADEAEKLAMDKIKASVTREMEFVALAYPLITDRKELFEIQKLK